jgi:SAM-dependent methyltransferase
MNTAHSNDEQSKAWNGASGQAWIEAQEPLDRMFRGFEDVLVSEARDAHARSILDVGCGTGATTLALARAMDADTRCVGIDLSAPMIEVARTRAARAGSRAEFVAADASSVDFGAARFDLFVSRFGVMFFADPVLAFARLRAIAVDGARLRCVAWREPAENSFMTAAERAAAPLLPALPPRDPTAPGQFAFADPGRVRGILAAAGWDAVELQPLDVECALRASELEDYLQRLGPVARMLPELDADLHSRVLAAVRSGFAPFTHGDEVRYTAACWMIAARAA